MKRVTVYRATVLDIRRGEDVEMPRYGTKDAIQRANGTIIEGSAVEVDEADLDGNGLLRRDE